MHLSDPWWVYVLRGAGVYLCLLIVLRLIGKRAFGDMTTFDIVVLMLVGSTLRIAITGEDKSPLSAVIGVIPIFLLDKAMGWACARWPWLERVVEGKDSLLASGGQILDGALRRHDMAEAAFRRALREKGVRDIGDAAEVRLEANGKVSVLKVARRE